MSGQWKDTAAGLLHRTGPATAELLDPTTGNAYAFDFAYFADGLAFGVKDGREIADDIFAEQA